MSMCENNNNYVLYKKRYFVLIMVALLNLVYTFQVYQYSIIGNLIKKFYSVNDQQVAWTAVINFVASVFTVLPSTVILNKYGLRTNFMLAAFFNSVATIVKCFGVHGDLFWVSLVAQTLNGISSTFNAPLTLQVSRAWFSTHEVTRAANVAFMFFTFGSMASSVIPVILVPNAADHALIANGLRLMFTGQAIISTIILIAGLFFFDDRPQTPPSFSEANVDLIRTERTYFQWLLEVFNKNFVIVMLICGLDSALRNSLNILLNQLLISTLKSELYVGLIGLLSAVAKIFSTSVVAYLLDLNHCYKAMIYACSWLSIMLYFTFAFALHLKAVSFIIISSIALAAALGPNSPTFMNFAAELTYPVPECIPNGVLLLVMQVNSIVLTPLISAMITNIGPVVSNLSQGFLMFFVVFGAFFVSNDLRRQKLENEKQPLLPR